MQLYAIRRHVNLYSLVNEKSSITVRLIGISAITSLFSHIDKHTKYLSFYNFITFPHNQSPKIYSENAILIFF